MKLYLWMLMFVPDVLARYKRDPVDLTCSLTRIDLKMDKAIVNIVSQVNRNISVYMQTEECDKCDLQLTKILPGFINCYMVVDAAFPSRMDIRPSDPETITAGCGEVDLNRRFLEYGEYVITIGPEGYNVICLGPTIVRDIPWYKMTWFGELVCIFQPYGTIPLFCCLIAYIRRKYGDNFVMNWASVILPAEGTKENEEQKKLDKKENGGHTRERYYFVDILRGCAIVSMLWQTGGYDGWGHAKWNGCHIADVMFPMFIFLMGVSMASSLHGRSQNPQSRSILLRSIRNRSLIFIFFGLLMNLCAAGKNVTLSTIRIPGVLQRFGITYFVSAYLYVMLLPNTRSTRWTAFKDIVPYWRIWTVNLLVITMHEGLTFGLTVPGCPRGYVGPGGLHDSGKFRNCTGGAAGYIDSILLGPNHLLQSSMSKEVYQSEVPFDAEGILGCLTSCFLCFLGLQAGTILLEYKDWQERVRRFIAWGLTLVFVVLILCKAQKNDGWIPINKSLWSLTYVLLIAGMAYLLLTFFYMMTEVWKIWSGDPYLYPGRNALTMYIAPWIIMKILPSFLFSTHALFLATNCIFTALWCFVAFYMYCNNIHFSL